MKKMLTAMALAITSLSAQADPQTWYFKYTGLYFYEQSRFIADLAVGGQFSGEDLNHDGLLSHDELSSLQLFNYDYIGCEPWNNEYWRCGVGQNFSFNLSNKTLQMQAGSSGRDPEGWVGHSFGVSSTYGYHSDYYTPNRSFTEHWQITPQTQFTVTSVPEASTWGMLLAGLGGLGLIARRRRQA